MFGQRLVPRQQQSARVATGVSLPHELEIRDDVLVVRDDTVKFLQQIENDVGLPVADSAAQLREAVEDAEAMYVVAGFAQRGRHVVLSAPLFDLLVGPALEAFRWHQARVHYDERAQFLHRGS